MLGLLETTAQQQRLGEVLAERADLEGAGEDGAHLDRQLVEPSTPDVVLLGGHEQAQLGGSPLGMPSLYVAGLVGQQVRGVLTDDLLEEVPGRVAGPDVHQVLVGEQGEHPRRVSRRAVGLGDRAGRGDGERPGELAEGSEELAGLVVEQVDAPADGGPQRTLARPVLGAQQPQRVAEPGRQAVEPEQGVARRRELDRQGHSLQLAAQVGDPWVVGHDAPRRLGTDAEELDRVVARKARQLVDPLVGRPERRPAGGDDGELRASREEPVQEGGDRRDQVLAVVHHEHGVAAAQRLGQRVVQRAPRRLCDSHGRGHRGDHGVGRGDLAQVDEPRAVRPVAGHLLHGMRREPGLPHTSRTGHGHPAVLPHAVLQVGGLGAAAHEPARRARPVLQPSRGQESELLGPARQRSSIRDTELADDGGDVGLDGAHREREPLGDLQVGQVPGDEDEDVTLPVGHSDR
jgi:hypothetical protein